MMNEEQDEAINVLYCARLCEELHRSFEQIERGELTLNTVAANLRWLTSEAEHLVEILGGSVVLGTQRDSSYRDIN